MATPVEKPLVIGRKNIMALIQVENWDAALRLVQEESCPVAKVGGRWLGKRKNIEKWLDDRTGMNVGGMTQEDFKTVVAMIQGLTKILPQKIPGRSRGRRAARRRAAKIRNFYRQGI
jgi:hypothetical protein